MNNLYITDHAEERFKTRTGLPKRLVTKKATEALELGISHAESVGQLRKYFDKLFLAQEKANNIRVYHNHVYLFANEALLTVFPLPANLRKTAEKIQRKKMEELSNAE